MFDMKFFQTIFRRAFWAIVLSLAALSAQAQNAMIQSHCDLSRDGVNSNETLLAPSNVNVTDFGKLFSQSVVGKIYGQPLYVPNLNIGGTTHNVVFVGTMGDNVYAFDADTNQAALWHDSFTGISGGVTVTTIP